MTENFPFRSSMNGFNRNDVIQYIDEILTEKAETENRIGELEKKIEALKSDNDFLRKLVNEMSSKLESASKCDECEIVKVYEARLGAAMLDAKRFSEILVQEANDKAAGLFADAYKSAEKTSDKAKAISANITEINTQFNASFRLLLDNMHALENSLEDFKGEVKASGSIFDFSTDFLPVHTEGTNNTVANDTDTADEGTSDTDTDSARSLIDEPVIPDLSVDFGDDKTEASSADAFVSVNFDDADEYDFKVDIDV